MAFKILETPIFRIKMANLQFAPMLIPTVVFLVLLPIFLRLGFWQLDRAQEKREIQANLLNKSQQEPMDLADALKLPNSDQTPVVILGEPQSEIAFVIDNQKQGKRLGYEVLALFKPEASEQWLLVSRGWLPRKDFYQKVPDIPEFSDSIIQGNLYFSKGDNSVVAANAQWEQYDNKHLIGGFDLETIKEKAQGMGYHIAPFVVRQKAEQDSPFIRNWPAIASPPAKHTAYAIQWFGMALALIIIFFIVNTKRLVTVRIDSEE